MNVKMYLNQLSTLEAVIRARKKQLDRLRKERTYLSGVSYDSDRVQSSGNTDQMKGSDVLIDLEIEIADKVRAAVALREKIISEIEQLQNPQYVQLLMYRYIDGMRFERIACEMGYSYVRVTHLHGEALREFAKLKDDIAKAKE
jgi:DNA-directed RNA polymerase specialized sigma subunit